MLSHILLSMAALTQADFEAARTGFFPSIESTLNHILTVDWFYVDALEGGDLGPAAWANETPCRTVHDLQISVSATAFSISPPAAG